MRSTIITVYTKAGSEYTFSDAAHPGSGMSALTQFTSGQDIHAYDDQGNETYIPFYAIDHVIVTHSEQIGPKDEVCGIDPCEDVPFSANDNIGSNPPISLPADITLELDPIHNERYLYVWCGNTDQSNAMDLVSWSSDEPGVQFFEGHIGDVRSVAILFTSTGTWAITVRAENGCEITFPVTVS